MLLRFILIFIALITATTPARAAVTLNEDRSNAVILAYHRIGEDTQPETSLRIEQFQAHFEELQSGEYNILPLSNVIEAIKNAQPLPPRTIAITFEGAYQSAYDHGMKKLIKANIPFTVIYAADHAAQNARQYLGTDTLKSLNRNKNIELGILPANYTHFTATSEEDVKRQINKARTFHRNIFKSEATIFSYPFGEWSIAYRDIIENAGFTAALGLHSGSAHSSTDIYALPRFSMTEQFGSLERFTLVTNALPLPATEIEPNDPYHRDPMLNIGFSLPEKLRKEAQSQLNCFISNQPKPTIEIIGSRVEIRPAEAITAERVRVNCTMPVPSLIDGRVDKDAPKRWRWLGMLFLNASL